MNWVGGTTEKERTKLAGGGRDWSLNDDGTVSCAHKPEWVLGGASVGLGSRLCLAKRGTAGALKLANARQLQRGEVARLALASQPGAGVGKKKEEESLSGGGKGPWRYIEGAVRGGGGVEARLVDGRFIKLEDADLVLDVTSWKFRDGNTVNWVGGTSEKNRTKLSGGGKDWTVEDDGTVASMHHPEWVLGTKM